jgi:uncharacterized membrane protein YqjE
MTDDDGVGQAARKLSESIARLMDSATSYGRSTFENVRESLEAEQQQRVTLLFTAGALFLLLSLGCLFAGVAVILAFRATHPAWAAAAVATGFLLLAGAAGWYMARVRRQQPSTFIWLASLAGLVTQYLRASRRDS